MSETALSSRYGYHNLYDSVAGCPNLLGFATDNFTSGRGGEEGQGAMRTERFVIRINFPIISLSPVPIVLPLLASSFSALSGVLLLAVAA